MNDTSRRTKWNSLLRVGGFLASIGGMYISAQFSVDGFNFSIDNRAWIGWAIAGIIIVLESVWQKFGENRTLFVIAMICYGYGITTNVMGILSNRGGYDHNPWSLIVPIAFGLLLEVFPEPLLAWSISGDTSSDPLGKFLDGLQEEKPHQKQNNNSQQQKKHIHYAVPKSNYQAQHKPEHLQQNRNTSQSSVPQWVKMAKEGER